MTVDDTLYKSDGIIIIRELCSPLMINSIKRFLHTEFQTKVEQGWAKLSDGQCPFRLHLGRHSFIESILHETAAMISDIVGEQLLPTYSYPVINLPNNVLYRHRDRHACEFTASLTVDSFPSNYTWPIYVETISRRELEVILNPGDLVLYSGTKRSHWRNKLPDGCYNLSIFFHYVRKNGELSNWHNRENMIPATLEPYNEIHERLLMKLDNK